MDFLWNVHKMNENEWKVKIGEEMEVYGCYDHIM